jgi:hypothetical protein
MGSRATPAENSRLRRIFSANAYRQAEGCDGCHPPRGCAVTCLTSLTLAAAPVRERPCAADVSGRRPLRRRSWRRGMADTQPAGCPCRCTSPGARCPTMRCSGRGRRSNPRRRSRDTAAGIALVAADDGGLDAGRDTHARIAAPTHGVTVTTSPPARQTSRCATQRSMLCALVSPLDGRGWW